jgi:phosphatidylethanolamine-binding protein (PEBP) family uncharacterized protein
MSAGLIPALMVAAIIALSGCGGGGGDQSSATPNASEAGEVASTPGEAKAPSTQEQKQSAEERAEEKAAAYAKAISEGKGGSKHGPAISPPKGPPEPPVTPQQRAEATVADILLASPALGSAEAGASEASLPAAYTCNGKNISPPLIWKGIPQGSAELALFAINLVPVGESLFFDWAVAGLDPSLEGLEEGKLPKGAILGRNGFGKLGYSVCPEGPETIIFALYALPQSLSPERGFDPMELRKEVMQASGNAGLLAVAYLGG